MEDTVIRTVRIAACLAIINVITLGAACGGAPDEPAAGERAAAGSVPAAASPEAIDPCSLVTRAEAGEALGGTAGEPERPAEANIPPVLATCRYTAPRGSAVAVMTVMVRRSADESESRIGFEQARDQFNGAEAVAGLGENAFWIGNQLHVLQGPVYLNITGDFDLTTARDLAATALQRL